MVRSAKRFVYRTGAFCDMAPALARRPVSPGPGLLDSVPGAELMLLPTTERANYQ